MRAACVIAASAALLALSTSSAARGGTQAPASVTIAAVGDTMFGDTPDLPPHPGSYLDAVAPTLDQGAQIVFGNLEGTLTTATAGKCGPVSHTASGTSRATKTSPPKVTST